jgi:hypothetical protein
MARDRVPFREALVILGGQVAAHPQRQPAPRAMEAVDHAWMHDARYLQSIQSHPDRVRLWQEYKPIPAALIERQGLGVGVLPMSHCRHTRLIVPVFAAGALVGLRGRRISCQCDGNWLVSSGTTPANLPLYNLDAARPGCVLWIVENCADALLVEAATPYIGAACYSTSYWTLAWTEAIVSLRPASVVVALDNDLVGNGGAARRGEFIAAWQRDHPGAPIPNAAGVRRTNDLRDAGVDALLYPWGSSQHKADIGVVLSKVIFEKEKNAPKKS